MTTATPASVANEFLDLGARDPSVPPIDQMKLQKLMFYAHAWHLAINDAPLFDEDFEAWPWGPVVKTVYYQTANCGRNPVSNKISEISADGKRWIVPTLDDAALKDFLARVWEAHKGFTGVQLSNSTHEPGEPWTLIRDAYFGDLSSKPPIPDAVIKDVFKKKLENAERAA